MPFRTIGVVLLLGASACAQEPGQSPALAKPESPQSVFIASNRIYRLDALGKITSDPPQPTLDHPIPVPSDVLGILRQDPLFLKIIGLLDYHAFAYPGDWLVASEIDLGCTRGILVLGQGPMRGNSQAAPFWILAAKDDGGYDPPLALVAERVEIHGEGKSCRDVRSTYHKRHEESRTATFKLVSGTFVKKKDSPWSSSRDSSGSRSWNPDTGKIDSPYGPQVDSPASTHNPH